MSFGFTMQAVKIEFYWNTISRQKFLTVSDESSSNNCFIPIFGASFLFLMPKQHSAYLYAALAVLFWSTIAVAFKWALGTLDPFQVVFVASLVSFVFFLGVMMISGGVGKVFPALHPKVLLRSAGMGLLNPFGYYLVLIHAYDMITAQEAMTLNYLWPVMLALLSVPMLKQKMGWPSVVALLISFAGIVVIATRGNVASLSLTSVVGCSLAAGSSIIWALYWIFNLKDDREIVPKMMANFLFGTLYAFIAMLIFSRFPVFELKGWAGGVYLGLFEMGLTFLLWMTALKRAPKTYLVSQFVFLAPPLSLFWIWWVLGEPILPSTLVGLLLILSGIILQKRLSKRLTV
jgi:drug/metabolite transporter (DMT)-like permease